MYEKYRTQDLDVLRKLKIKLVLCIFSQMQLEKLMIYTILLPPSSIFQVSKILGYAFISPSCAYTLSQHIYSILKLYH